jgi:GNAT superfamily N-acetyltransferase
MAYPVAQAWVMVVPPQPERGYVLEPYLDWLHVMDEYRRRGLGMRLLDACLARWPDMNYDGATDAGEAFCDAYDARKKAAVK